MTRDTQILPPEIGIFTQYTAAPIPILLKMVLKLKHFHIKSFPALGITRVNQGPVLAGDYCVITWIISHY